MIVTNSLYPTAEQIMAIAADRSIGPVAMVNLLKFRERAVYPDGRHTDLSGRQAFELYLERMQPIVEAEGGRFLFSGEVRGIVIGAVEELWDAVGIAEYPSSAVFHRLATSAAVQAIMIHREAGLAGQLLIPTTGQVLVAAG